MRISTFFILLFFTFTATKAQLFKKNFKPGAYYNLQGEKINGLIYSNPAAQSFTFKKDEDSKNEKIDIDHIQSLITNNDSLIVLTENGKANRKYLAKLLATGPTIKIFCKFKVVSSSGAPTMSIGATANMGSRGLQPAFSNTYTWRQGPSYSGFMQIYMYTDGDTTYEIDRGNYIEILSKAMADDQDLVGKIIRKELRYKDLGKIINTYSMNRLGTKS